MSKLFIYIPTYNRPDALRTQLSMLLPQVAKFSDTVRILINDNASDKPIIEFQEKYSSNKNIEFRSNAGNIGANANIAIGFIFARANEFIWILSDNDIVTDNAVEYILGLLDDKIDFFCFNDSVKEPTVVDYDWKKGWLIPMEWRMGLISDALYNINSVKDSIDAGFYFHNSSFPHLAVGCAAAKKKGMVKFKLLPRKKINNDLFISDECPTDYSLAHVCMPLLVALFPKHEAKSFSLMWLRKHGIDLYRNRNRHYHLFLQSKATLAYYGGWQARVLLLLMWPAYLIAKPVTSVRKKLITYAKERFSEATIDKLKNFRRMICGR